MTTRSLTRAALCLILLISLFCAGCSSLTTATALPTDEATIVKVETGVRVASSLAAKSALIAVDEKQAPDIAKTANTVATAVAQAAGQDDFAIAATRVLAAQVINRLNITPKQRLIASQLADVIAILVQAELDRQGVNLTADQRLTLARRYVIAACNGVSDATALWVDTSPGPATTPSR